MAPMGRRFRDLRPEGMLSRLPSCRFETSHPRPSFDAMHHRRHANGSTNPGETARRATFRPAEMGTGTRGDNLLTRLPTKSVYPS